MIIVNTIISRRKFIAFFCCVSISGSAADAQDGLTQTYRPGALPSSTQNSALLLGTPSAIPIVHMHRYFGISDEVINAAVAEALNENRIGHGNLYANSVEIFRSANADQLNRLFDKAQTPFCLHSEGLKNQMTSVGPVSVSGIYTAPFVLVAAFRGRCKM